MRKPVERRQYQERQKRGGNDAADHDGGERSLHFRAGADIERHRDEAEAGDKRRHQHGPQGASARPSRMAVFEAACPRRASERIKLKHHDAVEHRDA